MKICLNVEISHVKEVVINTKILYAKNEDGNYVMDKEHTKESVYGKNVMPEFMTSEDMADYIRSYVGSKRWTIVESNGTVNIVENKIRREPSWLSKKNLRGKK